LAAAGRPNHWQNDPIPMDSRQQRVLRPSPRRRAAIGRGPPMRRQTVMRIAIYAFDGITMFHLPVPQMVFDEVSRQGLASWETCGFADDAGPGRRAAGYASGGLNGPQAAA